MTEQQTDNFEEQEAGFPLADTGPDSNIQKFLAANKIDLDKLANPNADKERSPEEAR